MVYGYIELWQRPTNIFILVKKFDSLDPKMAEFYTGFFIFRNNALTIKFNIYLCFSLINNGYILKLMKETNQF